MGTNYYLRNKVSQETTHVGKISSGWKFVFREHPEIFDDTRESVYKWIADHRNEYDLVDEGEEIVDPNIFRVMVEMSYADDSSWDMISYTRRVYSSISMSKHDYISVDGTWWSDSDFC